MSRARTLLISLWRTLVAAAGAFWLGGLLFYISVVIHTAHDVLGGQSEFGFVTRAVTAQVNRIAVAVLALLLVHLATVWRDGRRATDRGPLARWPLLATWLAMAALQAALFILHPRLDRFLDPGAHAVVDRRGFRHVHNAYMLLTTLQLAAGLLHAWAAVSAWAWT